MLTLNPSYENYDFKVTMVDIDLNSPFDFNIIFSSNQISAPVFCLSCVVKNIHVFTVCERECVDVTSSKVPLSKRFGFLILTRPIKMNIALLELFS